MQQLNASMQQLQASVLAGLAAVGGASTAQRQAAARHANSVAEPSVPFVIVPCDDGAAPPWPVGLNGTALRELTKNATVALITAYTLPNVGTLVAKKLRLAEFIGVRCW